MTTNPCSIILKQYHHILPHIATSACPPTTPQTDLARHFLPTLSPHSACGRLKKHSTTIVTAELYKHVFKHENDHFHLLPSILSPCTSYPLIAMSCSCVKHHLTLLTFLLCIQCKLRLHIYPNRTACICGHHDHDIYGDYAFCCERGSKKRAHNVIARDFAGALSPVLAQAGYLNPNTPMAVEPLFHLCSNPTA
jgi:hypothetical protein